MYEFALIGGLICFAVGLISIFVYAIQTIFSIVGCFDDEDENNTPVE